MNREVAVMTFHMDSKNYMEYIKLVSKKITESKD